MQKSTQTSEEPQVVAVGQAEYQEPSSGLCQPLGVPLNTAAVNTL